MTGLNKMNDIPDKYKEVHEFFAAKPDFEERLIGIKHMVEHHILTFLEKATNWFK